MRCRDADGVEAGDVVDAILDGIGDQAHGWLGRKDPGSPGHVFFQNVILDCPPQFIRSNPLLLRHQDIHSQDDCRGGIDREGGAHAVELDPVKDQFHIIEGINGNAKFTHVMPTQGIIRIQAQLGGKVKS